MSENATFSFKYDETTVTVTCASSSCTLCMFCCTTEYSAVFLCQNHMLLLSTDTYHVAFTLEVVLSQGKRQDKTRFKGQDLLMDMLGVILLDLP